MKELLTVGLGGFGGAILRYLVSGWFQNLNSEAQFPIGTLSVNLIGCLAIGLIGGWADNNQLFSPQMRQLLLIGFLGSFTTFSTFSYEGLALLHDGQIGNCLLYMGLHLCCGFGAVWLGYSLSSIT